MKRSRGLRDKVLPSYTIEFQPDLEDVVTGEDFHIGMRHASKSSEGLDLVLKERHRDAVDVIHLRNDYELVWRRIEFAAQCIADAVEVRADKRGGIPVIRGTRIPVSRVLAELAEDTRLSEFAEDYDLDQNTLKTLLQGFAAYLDRPLGK